MTDTSTPTSAETPAKNEYRQCAPDRHRVRLHLSYDGTEFHGWQRQTDANGRQTQVTGQGTIEAAVAKVFGEKLSVVGASRTDAGVHAQMQVAHFDAKKDPTTFRDLRYSLQSLTPDSLVIKDVFLAAPNFHSIASSIDKTYRYSILNRRVPSALRHRTTWWVREPLDLDLLNEACQFLIGTHDFKSFQTSGTHVDSTIRTISHAIWHRVGPTEAKISIAGDSPISRDDSQLSEDTLLFEIRGNGFLKQMVRNIVGTLVSLQLDRRPAKDVKSILEALDRRKAGTTAPPQGLFLTRVRYPHELDIRCRPL
ncbi:MAG: tRNA pseudouridine(38-40) synthase TruA [Bdellovibrionales bacterium]|jgi:tRNA pseudouridine38-40 synthase|nr:tRNA pseudouridine(38-40) synthase TruA [Bdellovibrionales bacterium]